METLKAYVVTKSSSDKTFLSGDLIWLSNNGDLNNAMAGGWLSRDEWDVKGTNDFECEVSDTFYIDVVNRKECLRNMESNKRIK